MLPSLIRLLTAQLSRSKTKGSDNLFRRTPVDPLVEVPVGTGTSGVTARQVSLQPREMLAAAHGDGLVTGSCCAGGGVVLTSIHTLHS